MHARLVRRFRGDDWCFWCAGGGKSTVVQDGDCIAENGVDTLGGGGAGSSIGKWSDVGSYIGTTAGNGGNGVVVIRITEIKDDDPLDGVSFSGQMEWFNIGEGKTRETVVVYKNVEAAGTLTLSRGVMARVLLVGGGGPGGNGQQTGAGGGGGAGGDGKLSDITGDAVYYAGGGAGGAGCYNEHKFIAGGVGGGGSAEMDNRAETLVGEPGNGVDGFGGGGAGSCYGYAGPGGNVTIAPGRGGNGVVIVRITEVLPQGLIVDVR